MDKDFTHFEKIVGITFSNKDLLRQAFTHRSYINEHPERTLSNNERLEFLGDAVLELAVTKHLYERFPEKPEGELTALRAALVNTHSIAHAARELSMNDFLLLSRGEARDTGRARQYILANTFEALIGALYLDQGYEVAQEFIAHSLFHKVDSIIEGQEWRDSKSNFQEMAQETVGITPHYKVLDERGPDHDKRFIVGVFLHDEMAAQGEGRSKQEAEQAAAQKGLEVKGWK